jgi:hypothetical protein
MFASPDGRCHQQSSPRPAQDGAGVQDHEHVLEIQNAMSTVLGHALEEDSMVLRPVLHAYLQTQIAYSLSKAYEGTGLRPIGIDPVFSVQSSMFNGQVATQVEVGFVCQFWVAEVRSRSR